MKTIPFRCPYKQISCLHIDTCFMNADISCRECIIYKKWKLNRCTESIRRLISTIDGFNIELVENKIQQMIKAFHKEINQQHETKVVN